MQNRFVCDIADFGKHGLLRWIIGLTDPEETVRPNWRLCAYIKPTQGNLPHH